LLLKIFFIWIRLATGWQRNQDIFSDIQPWIAIVVKDKQQTCCPGCFRPGHYPDPDIECEECGLVTYCSWGCRARDQLHVFECHVLRDNGTCPDRDEVRVMIRALGKLSQTNNNKNADLLSGGGDGDIVPGKKEKRRFSHLLSHKHDFLKSKQKAENIRLLYDETEEYLREKMPTFDTFIEVLGRLYINGFEICDAHMETYGWGVYLGPSILDHSCQPNCVVSFNGNKLSVSAIGNVSSLEEARISYLNPKLPTKARQDKLYDSYFFNCLCQKCNHSHHKRDRDSNNNKKSQNNHGKNKSK